MKRNVLLTVGILALAGCDKETSSGETHSSLSKEKTKSSSALGVLDDGATAHSGKTKSAERPKDVAKKAPVAAPAGGEPGKVVSPFSGELVDVSGRAAGDLVDDPKYPGDESKRFVVPDDVEKPQVPEARPAPGKAGYVFSPYNNKIIDVQGIPAGALVADPTYPTSEKKYFRVPDAAAAPTDVPSTPGENGQPFVAPDGSIVEPGDIK